MNKDKIETLFRSLECVPVDRETIHGREVFIGDGYSASPHVPYVRRGALSPGEFPNGCFVTWWWVAKGEDKLDRGAPLFFDAVHDVYRISLSVRQKGRINAAKIAAEQYIKSIRTVH